MTVVLLKEIKNHFHFISNSGICSQKSLIGIYSCSTFMEVTSTYISIASILSILVSFYPNQFAMNFHARYTIYNICTFLLQLIRPHNIGFFIKTCLKFYHDCYFLAVSHSIQEGINNSGSRSNPVDSNTDLLHLWVDGYFTKKID